MVEPRHLPMDRGIGKTERIDDWWKSPMAIGTYLSIMIVYATWRGFMEADFWFFEDFGRSAGVQTMYIESEGSHVLSPLYSPLIIPGRGEIIGPLFPDWLLWLSPAMIILVVPAGFRGTCYYYRKAYYRSLMANPVACAVSTPYDNYSGETKLFVVQNLHRFFMYLALLWLIILSYDVYASMVFHGPNDETSFGISVGTIVLLINVIFLGGYTLGCHSFRHMVGGISNLFRGRAGIVQEQCWKTCTKLNKQHSKWAMYSLFWVMFADFYVYMCTLEIWTDYILIGGL